MAAEPADRVFHNGKIYTVDERRSWAEAVAITAGRITYVGDSTGAANHTGEKTELIDLDGQMMLPGFFDCHVHLATGGLQELECNLAGTRGRDEALTAVRDYVAGLDPETDGWIRGSGWDIGHITSPRKEWLDEIEPDRPIYLNCADGHSAWVNSKALELAGITDDTPNPLHGEIHRAPKTGEATGRLQDYATSLVKMVMPEPSPADRTARLEAGIRLAHRFGITSIIEPGLDGHMLEPYLALADRGELNIRLRAAMSPINWQPGSFRDEIHDFVEQRHHHRRDLIDVDSVKMYVDGVVEYGSAALLEPYVRDDFNEKSEPFYPQEQFNEYVTWLDSRGIQVHTHAIGDRGVRMVLNAYQAAREANGDTDNRHHICHLQMIDPSDVPRFAELNVMATFQPFWAYESAHLPLYRAVLGEERARRTHYLLGSVQRAGGRLVGGSDWFVTSMNPLDAISVGVRRMDPELADGAAPVLNPSERVDLATMIAAYTINGAYANHREADLGSIEAGKLADLVVLDRNLFEVPATEIAEAKVQLTLFEGEPVYGSLG
jgi:predicted amidohydrolase YtcJ